MQSIRKFNNRVKDDLIQRYCWSESVLDLGFGAGGDNHKYQRAKVRRLLAVEPSDVNLAEAVKRLRCTPTEYQSRVTLIHAAGQDTDAVLDAFGVRRDPKVGVVAAFFSLTFLFESESIMDAFVATIVAALRRGGHLIGTFMDAGETTKYLGGVPTGRSREHPGVFEMTKRYNDADGPAFGQRLDIHINGTIVSHQVEYLAWFDLFRSKLEANGFRLVESKMFDPPQGLDLAYFSRLFRTFAFVREQEAATSATGKRRRDDGGSALDAATQNKRVAPPSAD